MSSLPIIFIFKKKGIITDDDLLDLVIQCV